MPRFAFFGEIMNKPGDLENGVLIGHDGYLFLAGGAHHVLEIASGRRPVPESSYAIFRTNIAHRHAWSEKRGIRYIHIIFPDKHCIIPEKWPLKHLVPLAPRYLDAVRDLDDVVVYPLGLLQSEKDASVRRVDTHLTSYGSLLVAAAIAERLTGKPQIELKTEIATGLGVETEDTGDLGSKLIPVVSEKSLVLVKNVPGLRVHNNLRAGNNGIVDISLNPDAPYQSRLVIFGDSFGRGLAEAMRNWFREVIFLRSPFFHPEIADLCHPDILITCNIERYLDKCLEDDARPNFFMYPHLSGESYQPSGEFARVFSGVLGYPRVRFPDLYLELTRMSSIDRTTSAPDQRAQASAACAETAITLDQQPNLPDDDVKVARALRQARGIDEADAFLTAAILTHPHNLLLRVEFAWNAVYKKDWPAAFERWDKIDAYFPGSATAAVGRAHVLFQMKALPEAEQHISEALSRFPSNEGLLRLSRLVGQFGKDLQRRETIGAVAGSNVFAL
jgi:hypothetical protein